MITRQFLYAGKAHFTVSNNKGEHFTFKVQASKPSEKYPRVTYFVKVFTGRENTNDKCYSYLGTLALNGTFYHSDKSRFAEGCVQEKVFEFALDVVAGRRALPAGYDVKHEGNCGRCGRLLTNPDSIDCGIGPECIKIMDTHVLRTVSVNGRRQQINLPL